MRHKRKPPLLVRPKVQIKFLEHTVGVYYCAGIARENHEEIQVLYNMSVFELVNFITCARNIISTSFISMST